MKTVRDEDKERHAQRDKPEKEAFKHAHLIYSAEMGNTVKNAFSIAKAVCGAGVFKEERKKSAQRGKNSP